ncbi:MAG: M48 family metallopeptidase [Alphaproteobacteria bacterium]|nr:M48 family metallopeptidase [Alphaproteobacteria bacterium]
MIQRILGLKTWIWANNFKSTLLVICFPLMLGLLFFIGAYIFVYGSQQALQAQPIPFYTPQMLHAAMGVTFQYLPGILGAAAAWVLIASLFNGMMLNAATGAQSVTREQEPDLYNILENLCISRGLAMPNLQVIEDGALNAYASGLTENSFSITVTRGLMQTLDREEMEGVLGHELTHIINRDVRLLVVTTVFVGMISFLSQLAWRHVMYSNNYVSYDENNQRRSNLPIMLIATALLAIGYLLALLLRFAISRKREFNADAGSVELTKNPAALASALRKISGQSEVAHVPPEVKQMFIENDGGVFGSIFGLFATHPPIKDRIAILEQLAGKPHAPRQPLSGQNLGGSIGSVPSASDI